MGPECAASSIS